MNDEDIKIGNTTVGALLDKLPHGSGIDCNWRISVARADKIEFHNAYHLMNENGMYDGWVSFKVVFFQHTKRLLNPLKGPCAGKVQILAEKGDWDWKIIMQDVRRKSAWGLKDDLYERISYAIEGLGLSPDLRRVEEVTP